MAYTYRFYKVYWLVNLNWVARNSCKYWGVRILKPMDITYGKLQSIQNAAARLLTGTRKYDHITPVLRELHWLPITSRIQYKVTLLVYKTLHGPAPQYLQDLIQYRSARPGLRSAGILLNVPMTRSVTYGDRAFCSIGPTWWNSLPSELKTSPSVDSFKRNLKTHLFKLAYGQ